jgi:hypothetical protein
MLRYFTSFTDGLLARSVKDEPQPVLTPYGNDPVLSLGRSLFRFARNGKDA